MDVHFCLLPVCTIGMVAVIMLRILHRDLTRYNSEQLSEEEQKEETGWKLIHGHTSLYFPALVQFSSL